LTEVTLYTKQDCGLCDEALAAIERVRARRDLTLELVDITTDPSLVASYGERIPVVEMDGVPVFELRVDEDTLERLLDLRASTASPNGVAASP
jgi:hypothetical protein